jgi:nitrogen fixation protein FixH
MIAIPAKPLTGKHVLLICFSFFGVMLAVNAVFLFFALTTFNGGEGGRAYQAGLEYNHTIAAARAQEMLGWSHRIEAGERWIVATLTDRAGAPVSGLSVTGEIGRPVADTFTRPLAFSEVRAGVHSAEAGMLDAGNWVVSLAAHKGAQANSVIYRAKERLWLKPNS